MTEQQIKDWKHERDMARAIKNDEDRERSLQECYDHRDDMMMECIAHQSDRVKTIMKDHGAMVESHKLFQQMVAESKAVKKVFAFLKYAATALGGSGIGALVVKYLGGMQ